MITHFAEKLASKSGSHRTDPVTKLELNPSSPVEGIVHKEADEAVSPQRDCTSSATKCFDVCDSSPVKNVVHRLETQQEDDNALESLKIRTKRDFFSEKRRSISVSHEKEKYNAQVAERAKREAETKDQVRSPAKKHSRIRKSSAMSSVRNMASRFEKKADQSLDNLSFRTVRSFFPTEKSIHVGAEKQKYEAIEQEKQSAKEAEEKFARRSFQESRIGSDVATTWTKPKAFAIVEPLAEDTVAEETLSMDDMSYTLVKPNETAALDTSRTSELHSRRHTVAGREEVPNVRGIAYRFETKRANSVVTAPVRTIDTFIVADSEVSVRVSAEKAKFENQVKTSSVPTKRTIDTFIVPKSEGSVCVSAEKAKFEAPDKQVRATVRTIDTFIVPDSEASVRVSAEKAKFEAPEKLVKAAVRTIDTFIVPESEVSIHVAAEKAKLEALEKQKQSELDAQAAIEKQKLARTMLWASEKAKLEQARQLTEEVKAIDDAMMADEMKESKVIQETEMAKPTEVTTEAETVVAGVFKTAEVAAEVSRLDDVALGSGLATETDVVTRTMVAKAEKIREGDLASDTEAVKARLDTRIGKDDDTVVVKVIDMVKQTEVAAESKEAKEAEEVNESEVAAEGTNEVEVATVNDAEVAKMSEVVETTTGAEVAKVTEAKLEQTAVKETEVTKHAADFRQTDVEEITKAKEADEALKLEKVEETEMDNGMMGAVALEEGLQTEEVLQTEETTKALKQNEMAKVAHDGKTIDFVQGCEMVTSMKKAKVTEEVDDIVKEDEVVKVVKETEEVTKKEAAGECNVVRTSKTVEIVDNVEAVNETLGKEKQAVRNAPNLTISAVEVTVERQTFGDNVSTAQHVHWLSLPVSVNPALARLHTVLSDHDPLTAYALYPSSPSSPSSQSG
ncbi:unnamed protein product [Peronospora belbahrii]|uniref:Uncharacterized protein n=1 Tax=Peronospora belbahrii TaxID=622444 RepID=A0AAU9L5J1_9STRA|nr:unnamed protein product [Peronospora belbahrii]